MINSIISFSIKNKLVIGMLTIALIGWGVWSFSHLPIDAVPDITNNQVQVISLAPKLAAQEVEQFITYPIENAMKLIPDVIEIRSISRFGLSVVTVVFKDDVDIYLARQQVTEKMQEAENQIPEGLTSPELGPITTGLGEIYQYVVHTEPGYEDQYSAMELRTIQDWIIQRQLAGTPGLAEVGAWGGFVKQYEVALNPAKLNNLDVTISEIMEALEENNENTGGAYIEKGSNAYVVRGIGMVKNIRDIENIVVKTVNGVPLLVRDIAEVRLGHAIRYGAVTRDGEGEVVGGVAMMLKGENSAEVIQRVKDKIAEIQKTLPEGVVIEPFVDRTKLVNKAIGTVEKNLAEGALIVIFILVLLLGNIRAGLLVASVIPLSMLFAGAMMKLFGVSGNLMSLGAIDFGLIVDGAVIIVESVVHRIFMSKHHHRGIEKLSQAQMDTEVKESASRMMRSASFGQIIILIVYLPILALVGIEGKMFRPMAQTVSFAILGALILSLTYVPMMAALFLSRKTTHRKNISDRIIDFLHTIYMPPLEFALKRKGLIVLLAVILFGFSVFVFTRMGGEFIPTLEEGDFAIETTLMQGSSLTQSVQTFSKAEKILKENFPEVEQIVSRIGTGEVPSDPMPIENGDMMVILKDKSEWTSAETTDELKEKMEAKLSQLPGVRFEITQPIQMRFNELMTGIRQDVAVKIYGENLELLADKAQEVARLINNVKGITDPYVEKVTGLPQLTVEYDRDKLAQYGIQVKEVNNILQTAFAGKSAGVVYEGEKRFDLVVRLEGQYRKDINDIRALFVPLPSGKQVPIGQIAEIKYAEGPAQVSRDNAQRRIYVGFNVRGRDVQSVIGEIKGILDKNLQLPPGYYITYGGQFENLVAAKERLSIAVPIALLLIFALLFFTFRSIKQALLIFSAIPLSAIGGVFALYLRDMPFSISAGVGFIALFGVAVLNGIVLIAEFNRLKKEGIKDIYERVRKGTHVRLRPVVMTASVAALGFLPMALSHSAGAEVQKPLATVVIGGLISATLLTLIVLPVLYIIFSGNRQARVTGSLASIISITLLVASTICCFPHSTYGQTDTIQKITLDEAIQIALENNPQVKSATLSMQQQEVMKKSTFNPGKTSVFYEKEEIGPGREGNMKIGFDQEIQFPTVYVQQGKVQRQQVKVSESSLQVTREELVRDVKLAWYQLMFGQERLKLLTEQDCIYHDFVRAAELRYKTGETSYLEKIAAESKAGEVQLMKKQAAADIISYTRELKRLLNIDEDFVPAENTLARLTLDETVDTAIHSHPLLEYYNRQISLSKAQHSLTKQQLLPDFSGGYYGQWLDGVKGFRGYQVGLQVPLWFRPQQGRIQATKIQTMIAETNYENAENNLNTAFSQLYQEYLKYSETVNYYESTGLKQADELLHAAEKSYRSGETGYVEYIQNTGQTITIREHYLESLLQLNEAIINIKYLQGGN